MSKGGLRFHSEDAMPDGMRALFRRQQQPAAAAAAKAAPGPTAAQRHAHHEPGRMNKTEAAYDQHLALRKHAGEIRWYAFEAIKLRLASATFLTVDFFVVLADGAMECHEVKGRKGDRYWAEEDAKVKVKVAAEQFPFAFRIVWPRKGGGWCQELFG